MREREKIESETDRTVPDLEQGGNWANDLVTH